ncbi:MAG: hypothetical protein ACNI27_09760 [Desulfovibrio sp.]
MKYISLVLLPLILSSFLMAGCGAQSGSLSPAPRSYVWFTGNNAGVRAVVDGRSFSLDRNTKKEKRTKQKDVHYEVQPGKHHIELYRRGNLILDRVVILGNGVTKEIIIP